MATPAQSPHDAESTPPVPPADGPTSPSTTTTTAESSPVDVPRKKCRRGFASMNPEKQKAIAASGGRAAHARGTAHEFTTEEARAAGRRGGEAARHTRAERRRAAAGT
jgi:general stress protein YciG